MLEVTADRFQVEVLESPMPVLVDFYGEYCGPCCQMSPVLEELADELRGQAKVVKVNAPENLTLAERYAIAVVPTFLVFRGGEVVSRLAGLMAKADLLDALAL